ncbi:MAG: family 10 glycosylhydrolase [Defluviitaleaceae bacterium]|nr:family 10 glycosylhydrolase [Defluviitaleaceae bacterium]
MKNRGFTAVILFVLAVAIGLGVWQIVGNPFAGDADGTVDNGTTQPPTTQPSAVDPGDVSGEAPGGTHGEPSGNENDGNYNAPPYEIANGEYAQPPHLWPPIPTPTLLQQLELMVDGAQRRLDNAATPGATVRTGRFYAHEQFELATYIEWVHGVLENPDNLMDYQIIRVMDDLQEAIDGFHQSVIDPYNRYRPFLSTIAYGEDNPLAEELRAAWIATVLNIDWPSVPARGTTPAHVDMQRVELRLRFDELYALGFNSVIFQISPTGDAFFRSEVSPWSAWLTGETNFVGNLYDSAGNIFSPLGYAIELARARNMEIRAWFNPYRITHTLVQYTQSEGIILSSTGQRVTALSQIRDEWAQIPGTAFYLFGDYVRLGEDRYVVDPGAPGVRDWIVGRVMEVVRNYDIDGVHFDDYFYPSDFVDTVTFNRHNQIHPDTPLGRNNWRREQTEWMIRDVGAAIRAYAPWVKFGVSPGGVWKSAAEGNTGFDGGGWNAGTGSASTTGWSNYHSSWADTRRWVIENFIDYLTPQIYWDWHLGAAPYGVIAEWWGRLFHDFGPQGTLRNSIGAYTTAQLFIGIGLYRMEGNPPAKWNNTHEMEGQRTLLRQLAYVTGNPNISGSMMFTQNQMRAGRENQMHETMLTLRNTLWRYPALVPPMPHLGGTAPTAPTNVRLENGILHWDDAETGTSQMVRTRYFVIYRVTDDPEGAWLDTTNPANIVAIIPSWDGQTSHTFPIPTGAGELFAVSAVNRLHDVSRPTLQRD